MKGVIKKLDERMFGFITVEGEKDLFFHSNDCTDQNFKDMKEGDSVTFTTEDSPKGPRAVNVQLGSGGGDDAAGDDAGGDDAGGEEPEAAPAEGEEEGV